MNVTRNNVEEIVYTRLRILLVTIPILIFTFFALKEYIAGFTSLDTKIVYLILVWVFLRMSQEFLIYYYIAIDKRILSSTISVFNRTMTIVLVLILYSSFNDILIIIVLAEAVSLFYWFFIRRKDFNIQNRKMSQLSKYIKFSLWQLFGYIGIYIVNFGDNLFIRIFLDINAIAVYNSAYKIFSGIFVLANVFSSFFVADVAKFIEKKEHRSLKKFYYNTRFNLLIMIFLVHLLIFVFSPYIFSMLFPVAYYRAYLSFRILLIASMTRYITVFQMMFLNLTNRFRVQQSFNIVTAILNMVLNLFFVPVFGIVGAAISTSVSYTLLLILSSLYTESKIIKRIKGEDNEEHCTINN
jgi:O-antigen/teichoic acid export membrane protein